MNDSDDRRANEGAGKPGGAGDGELVSIDLRKELSPAELEQFLANAREAGRTPEEHFKAITLGTRVESSAA